MSKIPACLIVDPFVSASILCETLLSCGIAPIAILTDTWSDPVWKQQRLHNAQFEKIIECDKEEKINTLGHHLEKYNILGFIYGREGRSIYETDKIAKKWFPQFCNTGNSDARANKYYTNQLCRANGLAIAEQLLVTHKKLTEEQGLFISSILPVVVKPTQASGSIGVSFCETLHAVKIAIDDLLGQSSTAGTIKEVLIQKQLKGVEYFVDSASLKGHFTGLGVFRYHKTLTNSTTVYRWMELVDQSSDEAAICINYVKKVLNIVGMQNGLAHTELFLTDQGPYLVEINPRISGAYGQANKMAKIAYDINQAEFFGRSLINPSFATNFIISHAPREYSITIFLQNWSHRRIGRLNLPLLQKFSSYKQHILLKPEGTLMGPPVNLNDVVAFVLLAHSSKQKVLEDANAILALEETECLF